MSLLFDLSLTQVGSNFLSLSGFQVWLFLQEIAPYFQARIRGKTWHSEVHNILFLLGALYSLSLYLIHEASLNIELNISIFQSN